MAINIVTLEAQSVTVNVTGGMPDATEYLYELRFGGVTISTVTSTDVYNSFEVTFDGLELGGKAYQIYANDILNSTYFGPLSVHSGYEITIDANGGSGYFYDTAAYDSVYSLPTDGFEKYSSKLLGYSTDPNATSEQFNLGMGIRMYQNWNLYCVWQKVTYTLSYYRTSTGSTLWLRETFPYDAQGPYVTIIQQTPGRSGYRFVNWEIFQGNSTSLGYVEPGGTIQVSN